MTAAKNEVFISLQHENCYLVGGKLTFNEGNKNLVRRESTVVNFSSWEE